MPNEEKIDLPEIPDINDVRTEGFSYPQYVATHPPGTEEPGKTNNQTNNQLLDVCKSEYNSGIRKLQKEYHETNQDVTEEMVQIAEENGLLIDYLNDFEANKGIQELKEKRSQLVGVLKELEKKKSHEEAEARELILKQEAAQARELMIRQSQARILEAKKTGNLRNITFHDINGLPRELAVKALIGYYKMTGKSKLNWTDKPLGQIYRETRVR